MSSRVLYGKHAVLEALAAKAPIRHLYVGEGAARDRRFQEALSKVRVPVSSARREQLDRMTDGGIHQGVVAVLEGFSFQNLGGLLEKAKDQERYPVLVACDEISDPHNLGAILRSTEALGGVGAIVPERRSSPITPVVEKAAAGATSRLPIAKVVNLSDALEECKEAGFWVVGADARGGQPVEKFDFARPTVLVVGSEGKGLRDRVRNTCDALVLIPLSGKIGSLNASVAAGVVLYEISRQRRAMENIQAKEEGQEVEADDSGE
ncbi:MAG: 23S rRNA (guanosine(2251)-2'-O)-methyltransferase RlmB [Bdellovibrionota bacterium]